MASSGGVSSGGGDGGGDDDEAAWSIATAETLRARGDLAEAAEWYRRAANALLDAGDEDRALEFAKLAAEITLLPAATPATDASADRAGAKRKPGADATGSHKTRAPGGGADKSKSSRSGGTGKHKMPRFPPDPVAATRAPAPSAPPVASPVARPAIAKAPPLPSSRPPAPVGAPRPASIAPPPMRVASVAPPLPSSAPRASVPPAPVSSRPATARPPAYPATTPPEAPRASVPPARAIGTSLGGALPGADKRVDPTKLVHTLERVAEVDGIAKRLAELPLFAELPTERVREVAKQVQLARYRAREPLCEAGGAEGPMFVLLAGEARVELPGDDASAAGVDVMPGEFVGARTAMYGGVRDATVRAKDALDAAVFAPTLVRAMAREFPAFRAAVEAAARDRAGDLLPRIAPAFKRLEAAAREKVLAQFETVALPEGALLFIEGEPVRWLHLVAAGEAEVYGAAFGTRRTRHARAGEFLGVVPLLAGEASGVTARAAGPMLVARLAAARFRQVVERHAEFAEALGTATNPGAGVVC